MMKKAGGFTLVEVIVSLMILSIIIVLASSILLESNNIFHREVSASAMQSVGDGVENKLVGTMKYADTVILSKEMPSSPEDYDEIYYISNGRIYVDFYTAPKNTNFDIFGEDYYLGSTIKMSTNVEESPLVKLTVSVYTDDLDNPDYAVTKTVNILNVSKNPTSSFDYDEKEMSSDEGLYICIVK